MSLSLETIDRLDAAFMWVNHRRHEIRNHEITPSEYATHRLKKYRIDLTLDTYLATRYSQWLRARFNTKPFSGQFKRTGSPSERWDTSPSARSCGGIILVVR